VNPGAAGLLILSAMSDGPVGTADRSQAILLPGTRPIENPSRRARSDPYPRLIRRPDCGTRIGPNHTVPL
jgi:hypothetical protein